MASPPKKSKTVSSLACPVAHRHHAQRENQLRRVSPNLRSWKRNNGYFIYKSVVNPDPVIRAGNPINTDDIAFIDSETRNTVWHIFSGFFSVRFALCFLLIQITTDQNDARTKSYLCKITWFSLEIILTLSAFYLSELDKTKLF